MFSNTGLVNFGSKRKLLGGVRRPTLPAHAVVSPPARSDFTSGSTQREHARPHSFKYMNKLHPPPSQNQSWEKVRECRNKIPARCYTTKPPLKRDFQQVKLKFCQALSPARPILL